MARASWPRVALLSALVVVGALALGGAAAGSTVPPGCASYTNFCDQIGALRDGGSVLIVTVLPHASEPALRSFEFETGTPVGVTEPRNLCHSAGTLPDEGSQSPPPST